MEEDWFLFSGETGPCIAISAGLLEAMWFARRFQSKEVSGAPAVGSHGLAEKTLQPHTFSRCMRREAKEQLRGWDFSREIPHPASFLSSAKNVTFWNGTLHKNVTSWNAQWLPPCLPTWF